MMYRINIHYILWAINICMNIYVILYENTQDLHIYIYIEI